jgi:hypothetical protein
MKEGLDCTDNSEIPNQENIAFKIVHGNYCFWSQLGGGCGLRGRGFVSTGVVIVSKQFRKINSRVVHESTIFGGN